MAGETFFPSYRAETLDVQSVRLDTSLAEGLDRISLSLSPLDVEAPCVRVVAT